MASSRKKKENISILKQIYHDQKQTNQPKESLKEYFQDPQRVDHLLAGAILFFGLAAIGLGFFQFKSGIIKNFLPAKSQPSASVDFDKEDLLGLKQKDTDQDGLSDYDEFYIYNSSPYLTDSDSDGVDDQEEVSRGTNPTCPEGQNCFADWSPEGSGFIDEQIGSTESDFTALLASGNFQPNQLRQLLQQAGMSAEDLAQFTDEELIEIYLEALNESQAGLNQPAITVDLPVAQVEDLTPDQLRQLLSGAGVSADVLAQISDADLMDLVQETLAEQ